MGFLFPNSTTQARAVVKKSSKSRKIVKSHRGDDSTRRFYVMVSLMGVLTLTSALLLALAPPPLRADASNSLFAVDQPDALDAIYNTLRPIASGQWRYIRIHHSRTMGGNALTLAQTSPAGLGDHFVVGNGDGSLDGEIQIGQRWNQQQPAISPVGSPSVDPNCLSICVIGDFDHGVPTPLQMRRLTQLVCSLQVRLQISPDRVLLGNPPGSTAGLGRYFPMTAFRQQLMP